MADTIVVMRDGRVEQVGTPVELYRRPQTPFVAGFIGRMNMLPRSPGGDGTCLVAGRPLRTAATAPAALLGIRPEEVVICGVGEACESRMAGTVRESLYLGNRLRLTVQPDEAAEDELILAELPGHAGGVLAAGSRVGLHLPAEALRVLR